MIVVFTIFTKITIYFVYYNWSLIKNNVSCLNLILAKKQKFSECEYINGRNKTNIKNLTYYFYNDIVDLDEFDGSEIKVDKKKFNDIGIYYLGYKYKKKTTECNVIV